MIMIIASKNFLFCVACILFLRRILFEISCQILGYTYKIRNMSHIIHFSDLVNTTKYAKHS
jgi:hypothetical protein